MLPIFSDSVPEMRVSDSDNVTKFVASLTPDIIVPDSRVLYKISCTKLSWMVGMVPDSAVSSKSRI